MENTTSKIPEQPSDVLLALDNEKKKIQAVKGFSKTGSLQSIAPNKRNQNQFLRIDKSGDPFSNFFSNFMSQLKNPSNLFFFKVPSIMAIDLTTEMQKHINQPSPKGEKLLKEYEVKTEQPENKNTMETKQKPIENKVYRFNPEMIDWDNMNNLRLGKERLEKLNILEPLLHGYKTNDLVSININLEGATIKTDARLSLQLGEDAKVVPFMHRIRKEPNLNYEFFGHKFSDEDKKNLLETGNMGRVVNLSNSKTGENIPSIVSVDRLTNELVALKTEFMKVPDEIKGVKLNDTQKQTLMEGKPLPLEAMISKKGTEFSATVQFNADKRYVEFIFDRSNSNIISKTRLKPKTHYKRFPKLFAAKSWTMNNTASLKLGRPSMSMV